MASSYQTGGGNAPLPTALFSQAIPRLSRDELADLCEALIDRLDMMDAPTEDMEDDDPAGECSEDEISCGPGNWGGIYGWHHASPGCPISDPGEHDLIGAINPTET